MGSPYPHLVFVYGTLKTGEPNHHVLQDPTKGKKELLGVGETVSKYPLVVASRYNIPYLLDAPGKGLNVKGEVYRVDDRMLASLDILENAPSYYTRRSEEVFIDDKLLDCHTYLLTDFKKEMLSSEFLKEYTASKGKHYVPKHQRDDTSLKYYSEVKNKGSTD